MISYSFYIMVSNRDKGIVVSQPYPQAISMGCLCDKARETSLEWNCETTIYQCYILSPYTTKALYRFHKGLLVRL